MRRTVVKKSSAIIAVILIFAALIILTVFPLRLWTRVITEHGDAEVIRISERINDYHDAVQKFIAQYDRLESVDIYVDSLEKGQYMSVVIYKPTMEVYYSAYVHLGDKTLPGYVNIPLGIDLEVGETYTILINGALSTFYVGYGQYDPAVYPYILSFAYHDTEAPGVCLMAKYNYEQPISKGLSLVIIAVTMAIALLLCGIISLFYRDRKDKLVTVHRVIRFVGNPIAVIITLSLMIMIYPLKMFDTRTADIAFYELGVFIAGLIMLYAINHENDATLSVKLWHRVLGLLKMIMIAAAIWFCCEYMNAFYTIYQKLAERKEMICLLLLLCLMIPGRRILKVYNFIYLLAASFIGAIYRAKHLVPDTEKEYDLNNAATTYLVIIVVLFGAVLINTVIEAVKVFRKNREDKTLKTAGKGSFRLSPVGCTMILLSASLIIFRNTRWWGVVLSVFTFMLVFCYAIFESKDSENKKSVPELVIGGLLLNFAASMVYCWLYRYYAAFNTGRFPFVFHTVTVTAEYMTVMVCAAMVLLLYKIYDTRDITSFRLRFKYLWKEFVLFGFVTAYMIFTMSRTAYLACVVMFIAISVITSFDNKNGKIRYFFRQVCIMALAVILCFPPAFTLQRILPAIYGHPKTYMIENLNYGLNGGGNPASTYFMGIERFADLFCEKILSKDLIHYNYPEDAYNYDEEGRPIYGINGVLLSKGQSENGMTAFLDLIYSSDTDEETKAYLMDTVGEAMLAEKKALEESPLDDQEDAENEEVSEEVQEEASEDTDSSSQEEYAESAPSASDMESFSNGRITIFKAYLEQMNLWGHDEMGAVLPWGEVAIHAHNTYIQVVYDNGIIAGICFVLMILLSFISSARYYLKKKDEVPGALLPYGMIICFGTAAVSEWVFQLSNPMTIALILSLLPLALKEQN